MPQWSIDVLQDELDALTDAVLDALHARVERYGRAPRLELDRTIRPVVHRAIEVLLDSLERGHPPCRDELEVLCASAVVRAQQQVPLESVLGDYAVGVQIVWERLARTAASAGQAPTWELTHLVLSTLGVVWDALVVAYLEEHRAVYGEHRLVREAILDALLAGEPPSGGDRPGDPPPDHWVVASVSFVARPGARPVGRGQARAIEAVLLKRFGPQTLTRIRDDDGWVAVPSDVEVITDVRAELRAALLALDGHGVDVRAGLADGPADDLRPAVELARDLRTIAGKLGRPCGVFELDDLLLEHLLAGASASTDRLAALLDPLVGHPDLLVTLEVWLDRGRQRRAAAAALHVHPNTVDYRLRRVSELLGTDLADPTVLLQVSGALVVRRLRS